MTNFTILMILVCALGCARTDVPVPGSAGVAGVDGTNGTNGAQGIQGVAGVAGAKGTVGATGAQGAAGKNGQSCTVRTTTSGVLISCPDGSAALVPKCSHDCDRR